MAGGFGHQKDFLGLVDKVVAEYAGESVPEDPEVLSKALVQYYSDQFLARLDEVAEATPGIIILSQLYIYI